MTVNKFKTNWILHYIEYPFLYLPGSRGNPSRLINIIIKPISYVHSGEQQYSSQSPLTYQYFYANFKEPIVTGSLKFETSPFTGKGEQIQQNSCKYRIYTYNEKLDKFVPINKNGEEDLKCSEDSLFENQQQIKIQTEKYYYYVEEESSEGDILHFRIEKFKVNIQGKIEIENYNANEVEFQNDKTPMLIIRHYPKMAKIYTTFVLGEEKGTKTIGDDVDFTVLVWGWVGASRQLREPWLNALGAGGTGNVPPIPTSLFKIYPKITKITYMEKEISSLKVTPYIKKRTEKQQITRKLKSVTETINNAPMGGDGMTALAYTSNIVLPNYCNPDLYIGDVLIHSGEEAMWCETGSPAYIPYQDTDRYSYGHLFRKIPVGGGSNGVVSGDVKSTFWKRQWEDTHFISGGLGKGIVIDKGQDGWYRWESYQCIYEPQNYHDECTIQEIGELTSLLDTEYTKIDSKLPLAKIKIDFPQYVIKNTLERYDYKGDLYETQVSLREIRKADEEGYCWADLSDVLGMSAWAMSKITAYDVDNTSFTPYTQWNCQPNIGLHRVWGQYENSNSKDYTQDTFTITQSYIDDDLLFPSISPIDRKERQSNIDISYSKYDEEKYQLYTQNCDQGCSCVVSYIKTTRQGYKKFFNVTDEFNSDKWLKN